MIDHDTIRELQAIRQAEAETGVTGMDSAGKTYAVALQRMGQDTRGLTGPAAKAIYGALRTGPHARTKPPVAMDAQTTADRTARFPHAGRLLHPFS